MTKHNYMTVEKLEELGSKIADVKTDIEILRAFTEGFSNPSRLTKEEIHSSYIRAHKFFELFFYKVQGLEDQLDDAAILLLESGNYENLKEYLPLKEMNLPKIKG